jgi:hypothetical protein
MTKVYLYGGSGKYAGTGDSDWNSPSIGATHKLILFLAQAADSPEQEIATGVLSKFGFCDIQIGMGKPIDVEVLNEPQMQAFQKYYEGALAKGSSIVWYP